MWLGVTIVVCFVVLGIIAEFAEVGEQQASPTSTPYVYVSPTPSHPLLEPYAGSLRAPVKEACREWIMEEVGRSWYEFRESFRFDNPERTTEQRARLRKLGVNHTVANEIYYKNGKNELRILDFCLEITR